MNREELFQFLRHLALPEGQWVVFGGSCLAAHGIRPANDVDIFVHPLLYDQLKHQRWTEHTASSTGSNFLKTTASNIEIQAFITCGSDQWVPQVEAYLRDPEFINGLPFMPLSQMYAWKDTTRRPKDIIDIELIKNYWAEQAAK